MNKNQPASSALALHSEGATNLQQVNKTVTELLTEAFQDTEISCQIHSSKTESVFAFIANGICATLHIQEFKPKKGGKA